VIFAMLQWKTAFGPFFVVLLGFVGVFRLGTGAYRLAS
jgi:hypothetical protein